MQFSRIGFVLLVAVAASHAAAVHFPVYSPQKVDSMFEQFKFDYSKSYLTPEEEARRKEIFHSNAEFVFRKNLDANAGLISYRVGINKFADLTNQEFSDQFLAKQIHGARQPNPKYFTTAELRDLPDSVDWVQKGAVTPVINQGQCGSSWAIPAVAAIEGQHEIIRQKGLVALSIQQMIDCCTPDGAYGCNGGELDDVYKCVIRLGGIDTAAAYPYNGNGNEPCKYNPAKSADSLNGYVDLAPNNETNLQYAIALSGPVAAAVDASQSSFQMYVSGVYDEPACSSTEVDHGVAIVGYGTLNGAAYWKVKNSWGADWGEQGYILMSRNKNNQCGIAATCSYPLL